jgi:hypothetical protein
LAYATFQNNCILLHSGELDRPATLVLLGLFSAAREDNNTTPPQAVFGSLLILPGQYLDSPEPLSEEFISQFSGTLSTA